MKTRMNLFPLCTSNVCPTNSGMIVQALAQVFRGCLARFSFSLETLRNSFSLTKGPFFALLLMISCRLLVAGCQFPLDVHGLRTLLESSELATTQNQFLRILSGITR